MAQKLSFRISGSMKSSDHCGFPHNRVADRHGKYKCKYDDQDIEKYDYHSLVASHIIARKINCLIGNPWDNCVNFNVSRQDLICQSFDEVFRKLLLFFLIFRRIVVLPTVVIVDIFLGKSFESVFCHDSHTEFDRIEH